MRKVRDRQEKRDQANGRLNARNLFWSWYEPKNFGDWVTPYLFEKLTGSEAIHCKAQHLLPGATTLFGCGSVLRHIVTPDVAIVWGSGIIDRADTFERPLRTLSVRGPRTRARMLELGYDCPEAYGDPALMLPSVYLPKAGKTHELGVIPHFVDLPSIKQASLPQGWKLIDVTQNLEKVVDDIASCDRTVSSSLHGQIVSHAYGVPSAWVAADAALHGDGVKFADYFESLGIMDAAPPPSWSDLRADNLSAFDFHHPDVAPLRDQLQNSCPFQSAAVLEVAR
ncbi:MAG: polysaccharide pyruvyl transferase family protein [Tabrizicola sp.]|nr:polysaccharide pyruvyl transferase family protein [Tabrizicola sp.]HMS97084.1 polysaccharide pyruvyl transferase family protein [Tabrizicola sp.]